MESFFWAERAGNSTTKLATTNVNLTRTKMTSSAHEIDWSQFKEHRNALLAVGSDLVANLGLKRGKGQNVVS